MSSAIKEEEVTRVESCYGHTHRRFLVASDQNSVVSLAHSQKGIFFFISREWEGGLQSQRRSPGVGGRQARLLEI